MNVLMCADGSGKTQGELAELACLDKSTMVHTLDALERGGLAARGPSERDRRARVVDVTDEGRELMATAEPVLGELYEAVLGRLQTGEMSQSAAGQIDALGSPLLERSGELGEGWASMRKLLADW